MNHQHIVDGLMEYFQENNFIISRHPDIYNEGIQQVIQVYNPSFEVAIGESIEKFDINCEIILQKDGTILFSYPFITDKIKQKSELEIYKLLNKANKKVFLSRIYYREDESEFCAEYLWQTFDKTKLTVILQLIRLEVGAFENSL